MGDAMGQEKRRSSGRRASPIYTYGAIFFSRRCGGVLFPIFCASASPLTPIAAVLPSIFNVRTAAAGTMHQTG